MANTTGTYTTGLKDELGVDMGRILIEKGYVTGVASYLSPAYLVPLANRSNFAFKSGVTTLNLDDVYVRNDDWREGNLLNWGMNNSNGQLGIDNIVDKSSPTQTITGGIIWKNCAAGGTVLSGHTAGIKDDGTLWMWGLNSFGQLGDNTRTNRSSPVQTVSSVTTWTDVACGGLFTAAIKNDGTLWTFGVNDVGQLGDNTRTHRSSPVQTVSAVATWRKVSCGLAHMAAIKSDGSLWLWGKNTSGQLGDNTSSDRSSPVQTISGGNWSNVACGSDHTVAIKTDGTLWVWGLNSSGQLGDNTRTSRSSPVQIGGPFGANNWKQCAGGTAHTCVVKRDGTLWSFGANGSGQLGDNTSLSRSSPVQTISAVTTWKSVSCGGIFTAATKTDGTLWLWGANGYGQLGDNSSIGKTSPVQTVLGGTAWLKVSCGYGHTVAISYADQPFAAVIPTPPPSSCWVARAVYGLESVDWVVFRDWLLSESPAILRWSYLKFGESFSKLVSKSKWLKRILKSVMDLVVEPRRESHSPGYLNGQVDQFKSKSS